MTAPGLLSFARTTRAAALLCFVLAVGCATASAQRREADRIPTPAATPISGPAAPRASPADTVEEVLEAARAAVARGGGEVDGRLVPRDCSGFVRAIYRKAGIDLFVEGRNTDNGVRAIARYVDRHGKWHRRRLPVGGDLVFFDNSYDRNGDGRLNDRFTHVGIVDHISADGTAMILHATNHGIVLEPMNLLVPHDKTDARGHQVNVALRRKTSRDSSRTPHLMSELFAGFATLLPPPEGV